MPGQPLVEVLETGHLSAKEQRLTFSSWASFKVL
jgi:hypothetical protein